MRGPGPLPPAAPAPPLCTGMSSSPHTTRAYSSTLTSRSAGGSGTCGRGVRARVECARVRERAGRGGGRPRQARATHLPQHRLKLLRPHLHQRVHLGHGPRVAHAGRRRGAAQLRNAGHPLEHLLGVFIRVLQRAHRHGVEPRLFRQRAQLQVQHRGVALQRRGLIQPLQAQLVLPPIGARRLEKGVNVPRRGQVVGQEGAQRGEQLHARGRKPRHQLQHLRVHAPRARQAGGGKSNVRGRHAENAGVGVASGGRRGRWRVGLRGRGREGGGATVLTLRILAEGKTQ